MTSGSFNTSILRVIIPQLGLILLGAVILVLDASGGEKKTNPGLDRWRRISPDRCGNVYLLPFHPPRVYWFSGECCASIGFLLHLIDLPLWRGDHLAVDEESSREAEEGEFYMIMIIAVLQMTHGFV